ncbi:hypothetical protein ACIO3R_05875 [Streptomyces sp. NPDC087428]
MARRGVRGAGAVPLAVDDVPAKGTKDADARSNRELDGDVKAEVGRALRH